MNVRLWILYFGASSACVGCQQSPGTADSGMFRQAAEEVAAGESTAIDVGKHADINDADLEALDGLHQLATLRLDGARIGDEGLLHVSKADGLKTLSLTRTQISDAGIAYLKTLRNLELLRLDQDRVTDACLVALVELPKLQSLSLWKCYITDVGLQQIGKMKELRTLSLDETQITDAGLKHLYGVRNLDYLSVWKTGITEKGLTALKGALPQLHINR